MNNVRGKSRNGTMRTRLNMTDLRAFSVKKDINGDRDVANEIQGTVLIYRERFGKWKGAFIAVDGRHWEFECLRVRE